MNKEPVGPLCGRLLWKCWWADVDVDPLLMDGLLYHGLVFLGAAAVANGADRPLWKGLEQGLVDEPHPSNGQHGFPPGKERGFFSSPATLV